MTLRGSIDFVWVILRISPLRSATRLSDVMVKKSSLCVHLSRLCSSGRRVWSEALEDCDSLIQKAVNRKEATQFGELVQGSILPKFKLRCPECRSVLKKSKKRYLCPNSKCGIIKAILRRSLTLDFRAVCEWMDNGRSVLGAELTEVWSRDEP